MLLAATGYKAKWDGVRRKGEILLKTESWSSPQNEIKLQKSRGQRGEDKEEGTDTP